MRKLREKLNNKRGFTLVELIVVIVIILILAAVLVPNVMRYIRQAREAAFKEEAAAYLTEMQAYEAEYYAKEKKDLDETEWEGTAAAAPYSFKLSGITETPTFNDSPTAAAVGGAAKGIVSAPSSDDTKIVTVYLLNGVIKEFGYQTSAHYINWTQTNGWTEIDKAEW